MNSLEDIQGQSPSCVSNYAYVYKLEKCLFYLIGCELPRTHYCYLKSYCYEERGVNKDTGTDGKRETLGPN